MEKVMLNNESKDDFIVRGMETVELSADDEEYTSDRPFVTHGIAERSDGATLTFQFQHGKTGVINDQIAGIPLEFGELRFGLYLRKDVIVNESRIIQLGAAGRN